MSNHISEDIPRLLTGEASRDAVLAAAEHLRSCPDCQQELVSAVVAHASLTSAHRFAPEVVSPTHSDHVDDTDPDASVDRLPPLTSVFAMAREEAEASARKQAHAPKRHRLLAVAAAAVVLVGGGVTIAEVTSSSSSQQQASTVRLTAFDRGLTADYRDHNNATVTITGDRKLSVDASKLPRLDSSHVYELWLTDGQRKSMQSVGLLGNDNTAVFTVPSKSLSKYDNLEVSVQRTNQTRYSGVSVLRGQY